ncbi:hypothetical protein [Salinisphaera shabanensis]|uniref:hypothetical protein n=1 Tax=Salinisphaera shabanensis TaxID=180542 RepID=UPI00333EC36F
MGHRKSQRSKFDLIREQRTTKHRHRNEIGDAPVVALDEARLKRLAGIVHGVDHNGTPSLRLRYPPETTGGQPQILNVSWLLSLPHLAEPLAEALLARGMKKTSRDARAVEASGIKNGLCKYLVHHQLERIQLTELTRSFGTRFANHQKKKKGASSTKALQNSAARCVISELRSLPSGKTIPQDFFIPIKVERGVQRQTTPTRVLDRVELARLIGTCERTLREYHQTWETTERLLAEHSHHIPDPLSDTSGSYCELGIALCALNELYPRGTIGPYHDLCRRNSRLRYAIAKYHGGFGPITRNFYPDSNIIIAAMLMVAIKTAYNPSVIKGLSFSDIEEIDSLGDRRLKISPYKARAKSKQPKSFPISQDFKNPAMVISLVGKWTTRLRQSAPMQYRNNVFMFKPAKKGNDGIISGDDHDWKPALKRFVASNNLPSFLSFKNLRATTLDIAHQQFGGDIRAVQVIGGQKKIDVIDKHYTSDGMRQRNNEYLATNMSLRTRTVDTGGLIDPRAEPDYSDKAAATPGWACMDPFDSPVIGERQGRLCRAYGACPGCALAGLRHTPYALARALQLKGAMMDAQAQVSPHRWLEVWARRLERLNEFWLPMFTNERLIEDARQLFLPPLPPLE